MSIYKRYFRVTAGPLMDKVREINAANDANRKTVLAFVDEIGAKNVYTYKDGTVSGFEFDKTPDQGVWKQPNSFGNYMPRKNTASGKVMLTRIQKLPRLLCISNALEVIGLHGDVPVLIGGGIGYRSTLTGSTKLGVMFVGVPWRDIDPAELAEYQQEHAKGTWFSTEMEHLCWIPSPDMQEIKRWEMEKEIDELNARLRAMAEVPA
ncbi:hypothetical protein [Azonexus sp. R2A61]|uniref:hypothetical protein n=1 Tax=Azonexus sp. R2A61 TaxID=2744443 RepID=UPI001F410A1F|nr:hypothetical protein [Azonexus sp. R2A61]